ncbi:helix-turn-helix domain-containing protein [uncultured Duncaniella sp.]|uniref:helix-turn-helix domain-containing protein n=1 Tax=uncultured Duncaniella sp. TaxID=2768039 RepID=UPI0025A5FBAD|nr:helix-turn-helix domain-containing protein [uncultured Duncaniella sp.]
MERLSQKQLYAQNKERYYDEVIDLYSHGKTAREIAQIVPISKSTIQRWVDASVEQSEKELPDGVIIPRTPKAVAKMILAMTDRIAQLERELAYEKSKTAAYDKIVEALSEYNSLMNKES